jgi:hypothetical protein
MRYGVIAEKPLQHATLASGFRLRFARDFGLQVADRSETP